MKPLLLLAASTLALGAAACTSGKAPQQRAALDCPASQGDLTRTAMAADRKSCTYVSQEGAEVTLQLIPVSGGAFATLDKLETTLVAQQDQTGDAKPVDATPADAQASAKAAAQAAQQASADAVAETPESAAAKADVDIRIGKEGVVVAEDGGTTRVSLPGIRIEADDDHDTANVKIGPITVNADGEAATVRIRRDVRLKGEALSREKRGVRATFISEGKPGADGYRFVGYEAGGPKTGPLAVAIVRAKNEIDHGGDVQRDITRLVRRNGGV